MVKECYQRDQSIVPQQALAMSNSGFAHDSARLIAAPLSKRGGADRPATNDDVSFIRKAFSVLLGMAASEAEVAASTKALKAWITIPGTTVDAARANLVLALLNHNDFVTLR